MTLHHASRFACLPFLAFVAAASGCTWLGTHDTGYQNSQEAPVLKVPAGLDQPSRSAALTIPASGNVTGIADPSGPPPALGANPMVPTRTPDHPRYIGSETSLTLTDDPASAFRRVSLALERTSVMRVASKDEAAGTITLMHDTVVREGGWFRRMTGRTSTKTESTPRIVHVMAEGTGVRVQIEDAQGQVVEDETAHEIIAALKSRLG